MGNYVADVGDTSSWARRKATTNQRTEEMRGATREMRLAHGDVSSFRRRKTRMRTPKKVEGQCTSSFAISGLIKLARQQPCATIRQRCLPSIQGQSLHPSLSPTTTTTDFRQGRGVALDQSEVCENDEEQHGHRGPGGTGS